MRVGVILFNKYPEPLEDSHWIKGGFPPSAYAQAKACVRKRNSVMDPDTGMPLKRFTKPINSTRLKDEEKSSLQSAYSEEEEDSLLNIPMLGDKIKQPSFLSESVDEEDENEIQKAWVRK